VGDAAGSSQLITALFGLGGVVVGSLISWGVQASLLGRRIEADNKLAQRRFAQEREQVIYKRRFELAETLLADAYRFRTVIRGVRVSGSFGGEGKSRTAEREETKETIKKKNIFYVPVERLERNNQFLGEFFAKRFAAAAQFGPRVTEGFNLFNTVTNDIYVASEMLIGMVEQQSPNDANTKDELLDILWANRAPAFGREDKIETQTEKGVAILEGICRPVLEQPIA
jgi:hypothetical protein